MSSGPFLCSKMRCQGKIWMAYAGYLDFPVTNWKVPEGREMFLAIYSWYIRIIYKKYQNMPKSIRKTGSGGVFPQKKDSRFLASPWFSFWWRWTELNWRPLECHKISLLPRSKSRHNPGLCLPYISETYWSVCVRFVYWRPWSNLVLEDGINLLVGDSEIPHRDGRWRVVESATKDFKSYTEFCSLDVSESFSEGMSAIVAG